MATHMEQVGTHTNKVKNTSLGFNILDNRLASTSGKCNANS